MTIDLSFQLYSARDAGPLPDVLHLLASLGLTQVEGYGALYADPALLRDQLDAAGLVMSSGHVGPLDHLDAALPQVVALARGLGMSRLFCPAPDPKFREGAALADWAALAQRLDVVAQRLKEHGLRFGWHNHHWEFQTEGGPAMRVLLEEAPHLEWEADIAWIVRGGADPLTWIAEYGARISTVHLKDIARDGTHLDEDGWADLGHGVLDWSRLMAALRAAGTDLAVLEHDKPSDLHRFASRSLRAAQELLQ